MVGWNHWLESHLTAWEGVLYGLFGRTVLLLWLPPSSLFSCLTRSRAVQIPSISLLAIPYATLFLSGFLYPMESRQFSWIILGQYQPTSSLQLEGRGSSLSFFSSPSLSPAQHGGRPRADSKFVSFLSVFCAGKTLPVGEEVQPPMHLLFPGHFIAFTR
jgi:hypothetical protein